MVLPRVSLAEDGGTTLPRRFLDWDWVARVECRGGGAFLPQLQNVDTGGLWAEKQEVVWGLKEHGWRTVSFLSHEVLWCCFPRPEGCLQTLTLSFVVLGVRRVPTPQGAVPLPSLLWIGRSSEMAMLVILSICYTRALTKCKYIPEAYKSEGW